MQRRLYSLNRRCVIGLVWRHLEGHPGRQPRVADLATAFESSPRTVRRIWRERIGGDSIREVMTYARVMYGLRLIAQGVKPEAAALMAGFRSYWNFNRQCKRYCGQTASHWRAGTPFQISEREVADALHELLDATVEHRCRLHSCVPATSATIRSTRVRRGNVRLVKVLDTALSES